jgi:nicotinate-nucleotide pyrophosphorylase (carboxylating)
MTLSTGTTELLAKAGLDPAAVEAVVRHALAEDLGGGVDVTTVATVPFDAEGAADLVAREAGVVAGLPVAAAVFEAAAAPEDEEGLVEGVADEAVLVEYHVSDGDRVRRGAKLATVYGLTRDLLTAERTALNLLCHLSGVATLTRRWADALDGTGTTVLDTRKTTPGLRALEKYAVRCGGGENKRRGLYDVALIKDNHVVAAGGVTAAYEAVKAAFPDVAVQVEVDTLEQAREAVEVGATWLLCDNMSPDTLREVVEAVGDKVTLEGTGGLTLRRAADYAATGAHHLSVGALTHSAPILDIGLDLRLDDEPDEDEDGD